tara:strand:- start:37223 stop:38110 length:888 start_codon:yes stop_codon:yes gene_type:complete
LSTVFARYHTYHSKSVRTGSDQKKYLDLVAEALGSIAVAEFNLERQEALVRQFKSEGKSEGYIKRIFATTKAAINWSWTRGEIESPMPFVKLKDGEPRERVLTTTELAALYAESPQHIRDFILLMMGTAARPAAVLELNRFQCNLDAGFIDLNPPGREQTKKRRPVVPLLRSLRPLILASDGPLITFRGRTVKSIKTSWNKIRDRIGLDKDVIPYAIRHTMATEMAHRGVPEGQIARYLGHEMAAHRTTARYVKYRPDYLIDGANALEEVIREMGQLSKIPVPTGYDNDVRVSSV